MSMFAAAERLFGGGGVVLLRSFVGNFVSFICISSRTANFLQGQQGTT